MLFIVICILLVCEMSNAHWVCNQIVVALESIGKFSFTWSKANRNSHQYSISWQRYWFNKRMHKFYIQFYLDCIYLKSRTNNSDSQRSQVCSSGNMIRPEIPS